MELVVTDLKKSYDGRPVLDGLSFTAPVGLTRIAGNSGIGKTTLGLETPDSGTAAPKDLRWAAVFQEDRLLEHLDAAGNLRFALGAAYDGQEAARLLEELGLGDVGGKKVCDYSGGMKRRLGSRGRCSRPATRSRSTSPSRDSTRETAISRFRASCARRRRRSSCSPRTKRSICRTRAPYRCKNSPLRIAEGRILLFPWKKCAPCRRQGAHCAA